MFQFIAMQIPSKTQNYTLQSPHGCRIYSLSVQWQLRWIENKGTARQQQSGSNLSANIFLFFYFSKTILIFFSGHFYAHLPMFCRVLWVAWIEATKTLRMPCFICIIFNVLKQQQPIRSSSFVARQNIDKRSKYFYQLEILFWGRIRSQRKVVCAVHTNSMFIQLLSRVL